jgi:hypothetical protein
VRLEGREDEGGESALSLCGAHQIPTNIFSGESQNREHCQEESDALKKT